MAVSRGKFPKAAVIVPLAVAAIAFAAYSVLHKSAPSASEGMVFHHVGRQSLDVTIKKDGELQAVNNIDIICEVEGSTTITTIVKEGSSVKKGDVLVQLDSSTIRQRIEDTTLELQKAEADLTTARELTEIQKSQNATNLESAQVTLELAQIDMKKYMEGDFPKSMADARANLRMAQIDLENKEADFKQVQELASKAFLTPTDVKIREVELIKSRNALDTALSSLKNLETYQRQKDQATYKNNLATAEARLVRTQRENSAIMAQKMADLGAKEQSVVMIGRKLDRYKQQFEACTIKAPEDGLVVYATSGDRNAQAQIQEGTQVRERQMILRLPDTSKMKSVVRIQEAQVTRIREGQRAVVNIVGVPKPLTGMVTKISVLADSGQRWFNPDLKEYPVDIELDETPSGLKPGVGGAAEIFIARSENAVAVPISTIYSSGSKSYVFMKPNGDGDPKPREVKMGLTNETHVQIREGLAENEDVLVLQAGQGRELLAKAGIVDEPTTRPNFGGPGGGRRRGAGGGPGGGGPGTGVSDGAGAAPAVPAAVDAVKGGGGVGSGGGVSGVEGAVPAGDGQARRRRRDSNAGGAAPQSAIPTTQAVPSAALPVN